MQREITPAESAGLLFVNRLGLFLALCYVSWCGYTQDTPTFLENLFYHTAVSLQIYAVFVVVTVMLFYILCNLSSNEFLFALYCVGMWIHRYFEFEYQPSLKPIHHLLIR